MLLANRLNANFERVNLREKNEYLYYLRLI